MLLAWVAGFLVAAIGALRARRNAPPLPDPSADAADIQAILAPLAFASTAQQFCGGRLVCWIGGGTPDLRGVRLDASGARLDGGIGVTGALAERRSDPADWDVTD